MLTADTLRLVEGLVQAQALGPMSVKGLPEPVEVFELVGASPLRGRFQARVAGSLTRFVGREPERAALALAEALGTCPLQVHCHHSLGTLYATLGQREQARATLTTAIEMYRAMDMTFWLPQAEAALVQVGGC